MWCNANNGYSDIKYYTALIFLFILHIVVQRYTCTGVYCMYNYVVDPHLTSYKSFRKVSIISDQMSWSCFDRQFSVGKSASTCHALFLTRPSVISFIFKLNSWNLILELENRCLIAALPFVLGEKKNASTSVCDLFWKIVDVSNIYCLIDNVLM
jgi:hypothetical protein